MGIRAVWLRLRQELGHMGLLRLIRKFGIGIYDLSPLLFVSEGPDLREDKVLKYVKVVSVVL